MLLGSEYVAEVQALPARPPIEAKAVPTVIVHGLDDDDNGVLHVTVCAWVCA